MIKLNSAYLKKLFSLYKTRVKSTDSSNVFKGMLTLALGSGTARIIGLASTPIITRIYTPADYGLLALYISITAILSSLTTLRYSAAIPLPKTDASAMNLMALCIFLVITFLITFSLLIFFIGEAVFQWLNILEMLKWKWLIILGVAGSAMYELLSAWAIRKRRYRIMAKTQFTQSVSGSFVKIGTGLLNASPIGLIGGQILAQSAGVFSLFNQSSKDYRHLARFISRKRMKFIARYYRQFPYFRLPSQTLLQLSSNAPVIMMAALYSKELTGQLSLALMAVSLPTGLIGKAIAQAFYAEIAVIGKRDLTRVKSLTIDVQKKLFIIGVPLTLLIMFIAKPTFGLIFGSEWKVAGKYTAILAPFVLLQFTSAPLMQVLNIIGSQLMFLMINIIRVCSLVLLFLLLKNYKLEPDNFIIILSIYLSVYYLGTTMYIFLIIRNSEIS